MRQFMAYVIADLKYVIEIGVWQAFFFVVISPFKQVKVGLARLKHLYANDFNAFMKCKYFI